MNVVIVGCGRTGAFLAELLDQGGDVVSIVDVERSAFSRLPSNFKGTPILGNGTDMDILRQAAIESANAFLALTQGDNRNLMAAQLAREIFKVKRVITRIYDPIRAAVYREMGVETICSTVIGAGLIHDYLIDGVNRADAVAGAGGRT